MLVYSDDVAALDQRAKAEALVLQSLMDQRGVDLRKLAPQVGMAYSTLQRRRAGSKRLREAERERLTEFFGITLKDWHEAVAAKLRASGIDVADPGQPTARAAAGSPSAAAAYNEENGLSRPERRADGAERVVIHGDSMEPEIRSGDSVWSMAIKPTANELPEGEIVIGYVWNEATDSGGPVCGVLHWIGEDQLAFVKVNRRYPPVVCSRASVRSLSRVIEICRRV